MRVVNELPIFQGGIEFPSRKISYGHQSNKKMFVLHNFHECAEFKHILKVLCEEN